MKTKLSSGEKLFDLQLFAGEGGDGDGADGAGGAFSSGASESMESVSSADAAGKSSDRDDTDPDAEFAELIRGRYKDAFTKKTQNIINRRFKETKTLEEYRENAGKVLTALAEKYGTEADDFDGLLSVLDSGVGESVTGKVSVGGADDETDGEKTEKSGKNPSLMRARRAVLQGRLRAGAEAQYARWQSEAEELRGLYPSFDLARESENRDFISLLKSGVSLRRAYESAHYDEIMGGAMEHTARRVSEAISRSIQAKGDRPSENGLGTKSGINPRKDVASLTDSDILEILKQVEKGKKISF